VHAVAAMWRRVTQDCDVAGVDGPALGSKPSPVPDLPGDFKPAMGPA
jgi:hypothetical protein